MATDKKKKDVKVRDLKPSKDAKGGAARAFNSSSRHAENSGRGGTTNSGRGGVTNALSGRTSQ